MAATVLRDLDAFAFATALRQHVRVLLFEHSPRCAISARARDQYDAFLRAHDDVPALFVDVVADHATARGIAELAGVQHESPQAILFEAGVPVWHCSHDAITAGMLEAAWCGRGC